MKGLTVMHSLPILLCFLLISACANPSENTGSEAAQISEDLKAKCVQKILALDDSLGRIRNHDSEKISLSETIDKYVESSNQTLNFKDCPQAFRTAYKGHLQAWIDIKEVTDYYPEQRGEMHDLFETLQTGARAETFKVRLQSIWSSWEEVERAASSVLVE